MVLIGLILILIAIFILYKKAMPAIFGKKATGVIIGYGSAVKGMKGAVSYNYKVRYEYNGKIYIAKAMENVTVTSSEPPRKNLNREVTVYFNEKNPDLVSIKEMNSTAIIGIVMLVLGIISFFI